MFKKLLSVGSIIALTVVGLVGGIGANAAENPCLIKEVGSNWVIDERGYGYTWSTNASKIVDPIRGIENIVSISGDGLRNFSLTSDGKVYYYAYDISDPVEVKIPNVSGFSIVEMGYQGQGILVTDDGIAYVVKVSNKGVLEDFARVKGVSDVAEAQFGESRGFLLDGSGNGYSIEYMSYWVGSENDVIVHPLPEKLGTIKSYNWYNYGEKGLIVNTEGKVFFAGYSDYYGSFTTYPVSALSALNIESVQYNPRGYQHHGYAITDTGRVFYILFEYSGEYEGIEEIKEITGLGKVSQMASYNYNALVLKENGEVLWLNSSLEATVISDIGTVKELSHESVLNTEGKAFNITGYDDNFSVYSVRTGCVPLIDPTPVPVEVVPTTPSITPAECSYDNEGNYAFPTLTLPADNDRIAYSTEGVSNTGDTINGIVVATAGDNTIFKNSLPEGWVKESDTRVLWEYSLNGKYCSEREVVELEDPVIVQPSCGVDGSIVKPTVTLPKTSGISYTMSGIVDTGETLTITATALKGYKFVSTEGWVVEADGTSAVKEFSLDTIECEPGPGDDDKEPGDDNNGPGDDDKEPGDDNNGPGDNNNGDGGKTNSDKDKNGGGNSTNKDKPKPSSNNISNTPKSGGVAIGLGLLVGSILTGAGTIAVRRK